MSYYLDGREYRESTGTTDEKQAKKALRLRLQEVANDKAGIQAFTPGSQRLRVNDLLDELAQDYRVRAKLSATVTSHLKRIREQFGNERATQLDAKTIDTYIAEQLEQGVAPATINRGTQLLSQAYNLALLRGRLTKKPHIRKLPEKNVRQGFFEHDQFTAIINELPEHLRDYCRFAYLTGWRRGECTSLTWEDVDQRARLIHLRPERSKNGHARKVALEGELWEIIQRRWNDRTTTRKNGATTMPRYVFHRDGHPIGEFKKSWSTACTAAGLGHKLFHDLRRTAIRNMVRAGVPENVAMKISGHRTRAVFDRYNITDERDLRDAMKKTQAYLQDAGR
jgi:integrase